MTFDDDLLYWNGSCLDENECIKLLPKMIHGIYKLKEGINFLGYNFKVSKGMVIRYRSDTIKRVNKKLKNLRVYDIDMYNKSYASYKGYFVISNTSVRDKYMSE